MYTAKPGASRNAGLNHLPCDFKYFLKTVFIIGHRRRHKGSHALPDQVLCHSRNRLFPCIAEIVPVTCMDVDIYKTRQNV